MISKTNLEKLYAEFPQLNLIGRLMVEQYLQKYEAYIGMLRLSPNERLAWFDNYHPELANRLKQTHKASYLNMHAVTLSKIRSKLAKRK